jgi:hypothetical protein
MLQSTDILNDGKKLKLHSQVNKEQIESGDCLLP